MKNIIIIAILLLSTSVMSQTIVLLSDFQYDQGVESMLTVMYMPDDSLKGAILLEETKNRYVISKTNWRFLYTEEGKMLKLVAFESGTYQITQWLDGKEIQLTTISID